MDGDRQPGQRRVRAPGPLQAKASRPPAPAGRSPRSAAPRPGSGADLRGPVANDKVTLRFSQAIGANDALRTGSYSKTLTYTLSTTTP